MTAFRFRRRVQQRNEGSASLARLPGIEEYGLHETVCIALNQQAPTKGGR